MSPSRPFADITTNTNPLVGTRYSMRKLPLHHRPLSEDVVVVARNGSAEKTFPSAAAAAATYRGSNVVLPPTMTTNRPKPTTTTTTTTDQKENPNNIPGSTRPSPFVGPTYSLATTTAAAPWMMLHGGNRAPSAVACTAAASYLPTTNEGSVAGYHSMPPPPPFPMLRYTSSAGYSDISMPFPYLAYSQSFGVNGFFGPSSGPPPVPPTIFQHSTSLDSRSIQHSSPTESFITTPTFPYHHHHPHKRTMSTGSTSVSSSDLDIAASALLDLTPSVQATTNINNTNRQQPSHHQHHQQPPLHHQPPHHQRPPHVMAAKPFALAQKNIIKPPAVTPAEDKIKMVLASSSSSATTVGTNKRRKIGVDWENHCGPVDKDNAEQIIVTTRSDADDEETPDDLAFMLQNNASLAKNALELIENSEETDIACKCKNTKCLKLYCSCFQAGKLCSTELCRCNGCENTIQHSVAGGSRTKAIFDTLKRRPDAFAKRLRKKTGEGCFCKKTRCLRKYCDCFSNKKYCGPMCGCTDCFNIKDRLPLRSLASAYGVGSPAQQQLSKTLANTSVMTTIQEVE